jgi:NAD(P)-dependent dehydrogenase (short-subunit alcohol dehydrogenase family)
LPRKPSIVVVTGASSGIGRATAGAFADDGAVVVITARREEALEALARELRERGAEVLPVAADVTDPAAVEALADRVVDRFGRIDVWVNNASVIAYGRLDEVPVEVWHRVVETNLFGAYHGVRAVLPHLRSQGRGTIINVGSVLSDVPAPLQSAYVASKHAVRALSDSVRQETLDVGGIEVCTVQPGAIDTPLFHHAANYAGRRPRPPRPVIDPERVASAIVSCARKPRREVAVGGSTRGALLGRWLAPARTERAVARAMEREQFLDEPAASTPGNLFEPQAEGTGVEGGWRDRDGGRSAVRALAMVGAAGVAAAAVARRRADA